MNVDATLIDSAGVLRPIMLMALYTELGRFPRMFAQIETDIAPPIKDAYTFVLRRSTNDVASLADLSQTVWYVQNTRYSAAQRRCWLVLSCDPTAELQVAPFVQNGQSAADILTPRMAYGAMNWSDTGAGHVFEAIVSGGETYEQLARRLARLAGEAFVLRPEAASWAMNWGGTLAGLQPGAGQAATVTEGVVRLQESRFSLESQLQQVTLPVAFDQALHTTPAAARVHTMLRHVQLGTLASEAINCDPPLAENGAPLVDLRANWYAFTEIEALDALWKWHCVADADEPGDEGAQPISTLFLYDGEPLSQRAHRTGELMAEALGGCDLGLKDKGRGWLAYALAIPVEALPKDKQLVDGLLQRVGVHAIWQQLVQRMGCGQHGLCPVLGPALGTLPAIVVNNPKAPETGAVTRAADGMSYLTKIWVRVLGFNGELEVDWAVPFASHNNTDVGGAAGGDLILVPEENTLGYLSFLNTDGAPFFHAMTHYRDVGVSAHLDPTKYRHGLITEQGLKIAETGTNLLIQTRNLLTFEGWRALQKLGKARDGASEPPPTDAPALGSTGDAAATSPDASSVAFDLPPAATNTASA